MKTGRLGLATNRTTHLALVSVATSLLTFFAPCRADDAGVAGEPAAAPGPAVPAPDTAATPSGPDAASPAVSRHRPLRHLTVAQSIDESVRRLTLGLDLDASQQEQLRQILVEQHRRIMKLRSANTAAPVDVTGTALAIYGQTKGRIRSMLNEEQRKKYSAEVPRDDLAPAQADLAHWMDMQESKRRGAQAEGNIK